jgi:protein-arginine kinase activator protein McsA
MYGGEEEEEEDDGIEAQIGSSIEVIYSPQRICLSNVMGKLDYKIEETDFDRLDNMLKKAIDSENYELASKIRDVIKVHSNESKEKKDI